MEKRKLNIIKIVEIVSRYRKDEQKLFIRLLHKKLNKNQRKVWIDYIMETFYDIRSMEIWMETRFEKDINQTPKKIAYMYMYYSKINKKMYPYILRIAQKVKSRVYMRKKRRMEM